MIDITLNPNKSGEPFKRTFNKGRIQAYGPGSICTNP